MADDSVELLAGLSVDQSNANEALLAGLSVNQSNANEELLAALESRHADLLDLGALFDSGQDSRNLGADMTVRHSSTLDLLGELIARHSAAENLLAEMVVRHSATRDLPGEKVVRHSSSTTLLGEIVVRHSASLEGPAGILEISRDEWIMQGVPASVYRDIGVIS